uniref:Uncharacterized protein n=1 Tax=Legionella pneumophila TaxID=446 RepID=Q9AKW9_LEGPN|nr:hypothetical protein [Legionella pneumophila]
MNTNFTGDGWLKSGFKHVYAIERQGLGWICTDPSKSDICTYILPASYSTDVISEFKRRHPDFKILHINVKPHCYSAYPRLGVLSCVSVIQYILGVYWPFVFTPYQLYNRIKNKPPKHIEVIECHDIKSTQHKGKLKPPHSPQTKQDWNWKNKLSLKRKGRTEKSSKRNVY